jgi:predicted transcriptional regulator
VSEKTFGENKIYQFILDQIESVPHLEALLLLWNSRPQPWTVDNLSSRLYVARDSVNALLQDLTRRKLIVLESGPPEGYRYASDSTTEQDELIAALDALYRREVVRISTMIHSKPSASVREFAKAFRFTRERS